MLIAAVVLQASAFLGTIPTTSAGYELSSLFFLTCVKHVPLSAVTKYQMELPSYTMTDASAHERSNIIFRSDVTQAWSVKSKQGGQAVLWLAPAKLTCGVDIKAADRNHVETTFTELMGFYYKGQEFVVTEQPTKISSEKNGAKAVLRSWIVGIDDHHILLQGSFSDAPISGSQHKMTFTLLD